MDTQGKTLGQIAGRINKSGKGNANALRYAVTSYPAYVNLFGINLANRFSGFVDPKTIDPELMHNLTMFSAMSARAAIEVWDKFNEEEGFESFNAFLPIFGITTVHYFPNILDLDSIEYDQLVNVAYLCALNTPVALQMWDETTVQGGLQAQVARKTG